VRELRIVERYGQYTVTTSDGRKAGGATLPSALYKVFGTSYDWHDVVEVFPSIQETPEAGQIHEGVQGT